MKFAHLKPKQLTPILAALVVLLLITSSVAIFAYIREHNRTTDTNNQLSSQQSGAQSGNDALNSEINDLKTQLQDQKDKYKKLYDAVSNEHSNEINAKINKSCGATPQFPNVPMDQLNQWYQTPEGKKFKIWSDCVDVQSESFIQDFIDTHQ